MTANLPGIELTIRDAQVDGRLVDVTVSGGIIRDVVPDWHHSPNQHRPLPIGSPTVGRPSRDLGGPAPLAQW